MHRRREDGRGPLTRWQRVRQVGNLLNLSTPLGLALACAGGARLRRGPAGLVLGERYRLPFPVAGAFTVGNVITTGGTWDAMLDRYPRLLDHEERHTWQYLVCLGLPYFPAYGAATAWSLLRTGDRASGNLFERHAGLAAGGYAERPTRPLVPVLTGLLHRPRARAT
jgi:hypothetical protein